MPGRTPHEAVVDYLSPLKQCVANLGHTTIIVGRKHRYVLNAEGYWRLGAEDGLQLRMSSPGSSGYFSAKQRYRIVEVDRERFPDADGQYRVTTLQYAYEMRIDGIVEWQMHWHPQGNSPETHPHNHFANQPGAHLPCARHTSGCSRMVYRVRRVPTRDDWRDRLLETKQRHEQYRTWSDKPT